MVRVRALMTVSLNYVTIKTKTYKWSDVNARVNVALWSLMTWRRLLMSLVEKGHFNARRPNCLILFSPSPTSSCAISLLKSLSHCCTGPLCWLRRLKTDLLDELRSSSRSFTSVITSWRDVTPSRRRWTSFLASFTTETYVWHSSKIFAEISITAMTLAAPLRPSISRGWDDWSKDS